MSASAIAPFIVHRCRSPRLSVDVCGRGGVRVCSRLPPSPSRSSYRVSCSDDVKLVAVKMVPYPRVQGDSMVWCLQTKNIPGLYGVLVHIRTRHASVIMQERAEGNLSFVSRYVCRPHDLQQLLWRDCLPAVPQCGSTKRTQCSIPPQLDLLEARCQRVAQGVTRNAAVSHAGSYRIHEEDWVCHGAIHACVKYSPTSRAG